MTTSPNAVIAMATATPGGAGLGACDGPSAATSGTGRMSFVGVGNNNRVHAKVDARAGAAGRAGPDDVVDAVLGASRVLIAVAARSVAGAGADVTLPQYRVLVVLASRGPQRLADLSAALDVTPSTGTRMCDRLVRKRLVRRQRLTSDRRSVRVALTEAGAELVAGATRRRRAEIGRILRRLPAADRAAVVAALRALAAAAGEVPEQDWSAGW